MLKYQLIRSHKKNLSLQIKNNKLIVRAPIFMPKKVIENFIIQKQKWISSKLQTSNFDINKQVYFLGKKYNKKDFITSNNIQNLLDFYKQEFIKILDKYLPQIARENNFSYNQVRVKKLKSRWGSCSFKNNLNFNYLLIQAPEFVIKDVIIHELCHTIYKNHSKNFWDLVYKISPEYNKTKLWLRKYNNDILAINNISL